MPLFACVRCQTVIESGSIMAIPTIPFFRIPEDINANGGGVKPTSFSENAEEDMTVARVAINFLSL